MIKNRTTYFCVLLCLFVAASNLSAQSVQSKSETTLRSVIRKGSDTTYFQLLRMLLPDLQMDPSQANSATAHRTIPVRHIEAKEAESLNGNFSVTEFETRRIRSDGRQVLLLHLDLSADDANEGTPYEGEASLLAAFSVDPTPKLLDVMDIKTDRFTDFWQLQPVFQLNSQNEAFVVDSSHWNAGESYNDLRLLFLDGDRFKIMTSIFLLNTQGCAATFSESPYFRALPDGGKYPRIVVNVVLKKHADPKGCDRKTPGYTKYYQAVFSWNKLRGEYQSNSRQLNALDKFNRDRL